MANENKLFTNVITIALAYIIFGKPVLDFLGISKGAGTKTWENEDQNPNSCFANDFWRSYLYSGNTPANGRKPITVEMLNRLNSAASNIYYAFGNFFDNEADVFKAFDICKSKAEVSLMAFLLYTKHGKTLLSLLKYGKGGLPENGLSENELTNVFNKVKNLPIK